MATNILDTIDLHRLGELLQQARKKCGMTQSDAAQVIDAVRTTVVAIEKGERRLKPTELIKLARAYGRAISDFVQPSPVVQPFEVQFRAVYQRNEGEEAKIEPVILRLEELCRYYLDLEQIMDAPLPKSYPQEYEVENMPIEAAAESIAITERQRLGLGDGPIPLLRDILEQGVGLRIFYLEMPSKYSGIYSYDEKLGGCIAINANHPEERRRWSLAHEYLHFLAHRRKPVFDFEGQYRRMPESERLAEAFPKYFLMPTSGLLKRFNDMYRAHGKFTPTNLFTLAHYYSVSVQALVYRLEEMELVPSGTWDRLSDRGLKVRKVQQELGLREIPQRIDMAPVHYQHLAIEALDQGLITEGRFADFLNVDRLESRRIAESLREYSSGMAEESAHLDLRTLQRLKTEDNEAAIQFEVAISKSLLLVTDFESEAEAETFVNYAFAMGDDGESATGAIAVHRGWAIATDNKKAISFFRQEAPQLKIISTLEVVKYWSEQSSLNASELRNVLESIRVNGRYIPHKDHPLQAWWKSAMK